MCIFKVENKRSGRKKNLVMHKIFCWKQKVVFSFKTNLDFNLYSTPPAWTQIIVLGSDRLGERQSSSHSQRQRKVLMWTPELPALRAGDGHAQSTLPGPAPVLHQTIGVCPKLGKAVSDLSGLELCLCSAFLGLWVPCGNQRQGDEGSMWAGAMHQTRCLYFNIWLIDLYPAGIKKVL